MAITIRRHKPGLMFHSGRDSQYTSEFSLLNKYKIMPLMSSACACLDNGVVEIFFSSLKNKWLFNVIHLISETMKVDVEGYIRYYHYDDFILHSVT